jgi:hypothetical protein
VLEASRNTYFHYFLEYLRKAELRLYEMERVLIQRENEAFFVVEGTLSKSMPLAIFSVQEEKTYSRRNPRIGIGVPVVPNMGVFAPEAQG